MSFGCGNKVIGEVFSSRTLWESNQANGGRTGAGPETDTDALLLRLVHIASIGHHHLLVEPAGRQAAPQALTVSACLRQTKLTPGLAVGYSPV